jgi:hypothetical protein
MSGQFQRWDLGWDRYNIILMYRVEKTLYVNCLTWGTSAIYRSMAASLTNAQTRFVKLKFVRVHCLRNITKPLPKEGQDPLTGKPRKKPEKHRIST